MTDTFNLILRLSDERRELYRMAGQEQLTDNQRKSLDDLNAKIPLAWECAAATERPGAQRHYQQQRDSEGGPARRRSWGCRSANHPCGA